MQKMCTKCEKQKDQDQFNKRSRATDGLQSWCKRCSSAARIAAYRKNPRVTRDYADGLTRSNRRRMFIYLSSRPCVDCGESDPVVLEFDHVRGEKAFSVSTGVRKSWKTIEAEIAKCDIRCANCHRRKTAQERGYYEDLDLVEFRKPA